MSSATASAPSVSRHTLTLSRFIFLRLVLFTIVLGAFFTASLGTATGREWLANSTASHLLNTLNIDASIEALRWPTLGEVYIASLQLGLASGLAITAEAGQLSIDIPALFRGKLRIKTLDLAYLDVVPPKASRQSKTPFIQPESLEVQLQQFTQTLASKKLSLDLQALSVQKLVLHQNHKDRHHSPLPALAIHTQGQIDHDTFSLASTITLLAPASGKLTLAIDGESPQQLQLDAEISDVAEGWLSQQLHLPKTDRLALTANASTQVVGDALTLNIASLKLPLSEHSLDLSGLATINWRRGEYHWRDVLITTGQSKHYTRGHSSNNGLHAELTLEQFPLALAKLFVDMPIDGSLNSHLHLQAISLDPTDWKGAGTLALAGNYQDIPFAFSTTMSLDQQHLQLDSHLKSQPQSQLQPSKQDSSHKPAEVLIQAQGAINLHNGNTAVDFSVTADDTQWLQYLDVDIPVQHQLAVDASGHISGHYAQPKVSLHSDLQGEVAQQKSALALTANIDFIQGLATPRIDLTALQLSWAQAQLKAQGLIDLRADGPSRLSAEVDKLSLAQIKRLGREPAIARLPAFAAFLQTLQQPELHATALTLKHLQADLSGTLNKPQIKAKLSADGALQQQAASLEAQLAYTDNILTLDVFNLTGQLGDIALTDGVLNLNTSDIAASINLRQIQTEKWLSWPFIQAKMTSQQRALAETLQAEITADATLSGSLQKPQLSLSAKLLGDYEQQPLAVKVALEQADLSAVSGLQWQLQWANSLNWHGHADLNPDAHSAISFEAKAQPLPTKLLALLGLPPQTHTTLAMEATLQGSINDPVIELHAHYSTQLIAEQPSDEPKTTIPVKARVDITTEDKHWQLCALVSELTDQEQHQQPNQQLQLSAQLPKHAYRLLLDTASTRSGPLEQLPLQTLPLLLQLQGNLNLLPISKLINKQAHQFEGQLALDLQTAGTLGYPKINGTLTLHKGGYSNPLLGLSSRDIALDMIAQDQELRIKKTRITDQEDGFVDLYGRLNWAALTEPNQQQQPIDFHLHAHKAKLLQRNDIDATVSGDIRLQGNFKQMMLKGAIDLSPAAVFLDALAPNNIPQITVEEISAGSINPQTSPAIALPRIDLDLSVNAAQQAHIYGKGINAEIGGSLRILGDSRQPDISGSFATIRGGFEVLGKTFRLIEGQARIENQALGFSLQGMHKTRDDTEITALLTGDLTQLDLRLLANPALPDDEIIARLLFSKNTGDITPFQAIRLAQALDQLRTGSTSVFDVVGNTRELLGVDSLNVDETQTAEGETQLNLSVGKYLNDRVYLELEPGFGEGESLRGSVEIELSPKVNLESFTGESSGLGGIELIWKNDY
ncbi:MAG: translocation/assembly module TamB domain-containing protein [Cellvibrionaceae bacterium]|nr:translocation/assembly module TamB domain-containing protein [Cellvibrionaceae bacterium]